MGGGRKNLKRAVREEIGTLHQGQSLMQVVNLRGSNLLEVMDAKGHNLLAIFPAKFQKSMWFKRDSFPMKTPSRNCSQILPKTTMKVLVGTMDFLLWKQNTNRLNPMGSRVDTDSDSDSDTNS